jgi:hypothetical protein
MKDMVERLERGAQAIRALVEGVGEEEARFRPASGGWSILEVVFHLGSEETEDFRQRLSLTLADPASEWPKLDPEARVREGRCDERSLAAELSGFLAERAKSLAWLRGLDEPDWSLAHRHPRGVISAGDLLASWVAHDLLHIRQIARLRYEFVRKLAAPYRLDYAGAAPPPPPL